jgi:hypothetical protein
MSSQEITTLAEAIAQCAALCFAAALTVCLLRRRDD